MNRIFNTTSCGSACLLLACVLLTGCGREEAPAVSRSDTPTTEHVTDVVDDAATSATTQAGGVLESVSDQAAEMADTLASEASAAAADAAKAEALAAAREKAEAEAEQLLAGAKDAIAAKNLDGAESMLGQLDSMTDSLPDSLVQRIESLRSALKAAQTAKDLKDSAPAIPGF